VISRGAVPGPLPSCGQPGWTALRRG